MMLGLQAITRRRYAAGSWANGVQTPGAATDTPITGTWRPLPERDAQQLASGDRARDPRVLYTQTQCRIVDQHTGVAADQVSPDGGSTWYVLEKDFDGSPPAGTPQIQHYRYLALRVQEAG